MWRPRRRATLAGMTGDQLLVEPPPRYCPVQVATHPDADLLEDQGADQLTRHGLGLPACALESRQQGCQVDGLAVGQLS
jgi:hypothetical protein